MTTPDPTKLEVDFMILSDGAQAVGGKIYILGGGWNRLLVPGLPGRPAAPFAIALGITVPYNLTNRRFNFTIELANQDGDRIGDVLSAELEAGRPPGIRPGTPQSIMLGINTRPEFPMPGRYTFNASIDGELMRSVGFEVHLQTPAAQALETQPETP
jgi:hypothetical protein